MKKINFPAMLAIRSLSIKKLTILGFSLVALPLVLALLYSASQVTQLSHQSTFAIFHVAELVKTNRQLNFTLDKMERSASQFLILKDQDILMRYFQQEQNILVNLAENSVFKNDEILREHSQELSEIISYLHQYLIKQQLETASLIPLKDYFKKLINIRNKITERSNNLLLNQAEKIRASASGVRHDMLTSLIIIPFALIIAAVFIFLITNPLKKLLLKIQYLEQGNFNNKVTFSGSPEIKEIADALEIMRNRLHALELQKSSFIRHISHELKTPLAAIREGTELLYDNSVGELNAGQQEISKIIRSSVNRLQRLIEDLLDFNIVLDSTSLQDAETVELSSLIAQVLQQRTLDIKRKNLTVINELQRIKIKVNSKQLSVILDNLLSNAIKYSPINSQIKIACNVQNSQLNLSVTDYGLGISAEQQENIFDAFYQGTPAENSQIKGSGLGLTIVKELLMRLQGTIKVTSIVGKNSSDKSGTTMAITLPNAYHIKANNGVQV
ncbi:MAG: HAMP domain-containing histidine kinase [Colwellia sp.]|nr:HAMP domain-containing histidine kinase [Colwellia sp.]